MAWVNPRTWADLDVATAAMFNQDLRDNPDELKAVVQGDGGATIKHRHKSGTWPSRPAAGEPGRIYYCTDTGWTIMDDGTLWSVISHNPKLSDRLYNDFHEPGAATLTATGWIFGWRFAAVTSANLATATGTEHSYAQITAKTTSGASGQFTTKGNGAGYIAAAQTPYPLILEVGVRLIDSASVTYHLGLMSSLATTQAAQPTSSIMFGYARSGDADALQYFAVTRDNSGAETTTDSAITPTHINIDILRIEVDSTSEARFYVNGTLVATHAAGIPTVERLHPGFAVRTNANADKILRIEYIDLLYKRDI